MGYLADDEYELMPANELAYLRREVEKLKRNPLGDTQASITLLESINKLNASIVRMNEILSSANDDMVKAFGDASLQSQLARVAEQQEKLAKGIVAVAELVKRTEVERGPLPSIETVAKPAPAARQYVDPLPQVDAVQPRNPFEQGGFTPLLSEPLSRPIPPDAVPPELQNAPGFVLHPGLQEQAPARQPAPNPFIPEVDIPPPPPRRR